ncbi:hypothetical protein CEXT_811551 [Caerostris extrusa]|uniref:Uncharacterized protein n=1 Tax=Caerostris extrusa TaxID=172846 RepID=A0AAV4WUM0_CAEEX|nr:hypothetical protein CEXT_811551 [Caerostris extrusa]
MLEIPASISTPSIHYSNIFHNPETNSMFSLGMKPARKSFTFLITSEVSTSILSASLGSSTENIHFSNTSVVMVNGLWTSNYSSLAETWSNYRRQFRPALIHTSAN